MKPKNPPQKFRGRQGDFYAENLLGLIPQNVKKKNSEQSWETIWMISEIR